jgi:hypothetical protein
MGFWPSWYCPARQASWFVDPGSSDNFLWRLDGALLIRQTVRSPPSRNRETWSRPSGCVCMSKMQECSIHACSLTQDVGEYRQPDVLDETDCRMDRIMLAWSPRTKMSPFTVAVLYSFYDILSQVTYYIHHFSFLSWIARSQTLLYGRGRCLSPLLLLLLLLCPNTI